MEVGGRYLQKISDIYALELEDALVQKERVMKEKARMEIRKAVQENRTIINEMNKEETELLVTSLKEAFIKTITDVMKSITNEFSSLLEKELKDKEQVLNKQLCAALRAKEEYMEHEFAFQLDWQANKCFEEYQCKLKKSQKEWLKLFDEAKETFEYDLAKMKAQMESEHLNSLLELHHKQLWDCHEEKQEMQLLFRNWYMTEFKKELTSRDFAVIDLEKCLATKEEEIRKNTSKIKDLFKQFQKFINFALKAKPGQAEFLLSLQLLLKDDWRDICNKLDVKQGNVETETELIAKSIMEHMLKKTFTQKELEATLFEPKQPEIRENFAQEIEMERIANRALKVIGETVSPPGSEERFKQNRLDSLKIIFEKHPSLNQFFTRTKRFSK